MMNVNIALDNQKFDVPVYATENLNNSDLSNKIILGFNFLKITKMRNNFSSNFNYGNNEINNFIEKAFKLRNDINTSVYKTKDMPFECEIFTEKGQKYTEYRKMFPEKLERAKIAIEELESKNFIEKQKVTG